MRTTSIRVSPASLGKAIGVSLLALTLLGQIVGCASLSSNSAGQKSAEAAAVPVKITSPQRGTVFSSLSFTGDVKARSQVAIVPQLAGRLDKLLVDVGSEVREGDIIGEQDHTIQDAQVRQAEGNLAAAEAKLEGMKEGSRAETVAQARANFDAASQKLETLQNGGRAETVSQAAANLKAAEARLAQLKAGPTPEQIEVAEAQVRLAKDQLYTIQTQADAYLNSKAVALGTAVYTKEMKEAQSGAAYEQVKVAEANLAALKAEPTAEKLAEAEAAVDAAKAQLELVSKPYTEQDIAQAKDAVIVAEQQLKLAEDPYTKNDMAAMEAQVSIAEANLDLAEAQSNQLIIKAPIDGIVSDRLVSQGALVGPSTAIVNLVGSEVDIFIQVDQTQVQQIAVGQTITCTLSPSDAKAMIGGMVSSISPASSTTSRSFSVKITPDDPEHKLRPGMFAQVTVTTGQKSDALIVPKQAVVEKAGERYVFVVNEGIATKKLVAVGYSDATNIEITDGLDGSEQVVIAGHSNLSDNDRVYLATQ